MGLLDQFSNLNENQTQGLLAAASQMLQQSGPSRTPTGFGQIAGGGMMAYQSAMNEAKKRKQEEDQQRQMAEMRALQMRAAQGQLADAQVGRDRERGVNQAFVNNWRTPEQQASSLPGGPTNENAGRIPEMKGGWDQGRLVSDLMNIDPRMAMDMQAKFTPKPTEYDTTPRVGVGADGKPVQYVMGKDGKPKIIDGIAPRDELKLMDNGKGMQAYNPYALTPGQLFQKFMTPGESATDIRSRERLNFDRSQVGKPSFNAEVGGFISPPSVANPNGGITPLAGFTKKKSMTEDQGKATGWLVQAENAFNNMKAVGVGADGKPTSASKPGLNDALAAVPSFGLGEAIGNTFRGSDRQKFIQGSSSLGEALLRAATGAGVNRDEAQQKVREITPVFGDSDDVIKQKMDAIPLYIESLKVRSGPGATQAAQVLDGRPKAQSGQWSIQRVGD